LKISINILVVSVSFLLFQQSILAESVNKYRPLSDQEKQSACQAVLTHVMRNTLLTCDNTIVFSPRRFSSANMELLLVERTTSKSTQNHEDVRIADVYAYNYATDTLNYTVVNLDSGEVLKTEDVQGVQLPLIEKEIDRARVIANEDRRLRDLLASEYQRVTGQTLQSLDQLVVKAFVYLAETAPGQPNEATESCGLHRCARLVMHTADRIALNTVPIIDLSTGVVSQYRTGEQ